MSRKHQVLIATFEPMIVAARSASDDSRTWLVLAMCAATIFVGIAAHAVATMPAHPLFGAAASSTAPAQPARYEPKVEAIEIPVLRRDPVADDEPTVGVANTSRSNVQDGATRAATPRDAKTRTAGADEVAAAAAMLAQSRREHPIQ